MAAIEEALQREQPLWPGEGDDEDAAALVEADELVYLAVRTAMHRLDPAKKKRAKRSRDPAPPQLGPDGEPLKTLRDIQRAPAPPPPPKRARTVAFVAEPRAGPAGPAALQARPASAGAGARGAPGSPPQGGATAEGALALRSVLAQWQWRSSVGRQELRAMATGKPSTPPRGRSRVGFLGRMGAAHDLGL